jgi:membrane AbrB-like protein
MSGLKLQAYTMRSGLRTAVSLLVALAAAQLCVWLHTPIPWMLGPLLVTALASVLGAPTRSAPLLRNAGQWVIGVVLGLYFTPQVGALVVSLWWAIALAVLWALLLGALFDAWLQHRHRAELAHLPPSAWRATTYFASAIGGASEMTLLAERHGARTDLVAAAHSVRLVLVVLTLPFAMQWAQSHWGLQVDARLLPGPVVAHWPGLFWLALSTGVGALVMVGFKRTNPWFMGALLVSMGLTLSGVHWSAVPTELSNAAQLVIGVSLGVRFQREFVHTAPRWLATAASGSVVMMLLSLGFGLFLAHTTYLHPATLILGTAPGGIAEMAITAKVLQLGVPVVTAFQVCRLVAVLILVGPIFQWSHRRKKTA